MPRKRRKRLGRYIVVDPEICHGKPTFLGTRVMVAEVLKQVAKGTSWDAITAEWRGSVTKDAIFEAVELAQRIFKDHDSGALASMNISDEKVLRASAMLTTDPTCRPPAD